jgi:NAD(P)-dependent dehydrogenase (short-subunit alcohol dehydrogenase family)
VRTTILTLISLFACCGIVAAADTRADTPGSATRQKAILVTGASTGIGRNIVEHLSAEGYFIYATARKDADLAALAKLKNVQPIRLDVTKPEEIAAAVETVRAAGRGLYGLVNNAGVGTGFPVLEGNDAEFDLCMQVNVYGPYRVTKAFAPMVVAEKGRIVNMGSIAGFFAFPGGVPYTMTKHAVEAFTDALGLELEPVGVQVSVIEPGDFNSDIAKNAMQRGMNVPAKILNRSVFPAPDAVTDAVRHALFDTKARRRYMVVSNEGEANFTISQELRRLAQTNESQAFRYDRTKLIEMLDAAIAEEKTATR